MVIARDLKRQNVREEQELPTKLAPPPGAPSYEYLVHIAEQEIQCEEPTSPPLTPAEHEVLTDQSVPVANDNGMLSRRTWYSAATNATSIAPSFIWLL